MNIRSSSIYLLLCGAAIASAQVNVLTANYDNNRTNSNPNETILTQENVNTSNFGKIGYFPVDGEIYAQPLYVSGVQITGQGMHNVVYVASMHNSLYAIDADQPGSTTPLWQVNFGTSVSSTILNFTDILPEVGILSTPVIDLTRQIIYVVSDTLEGGTPVFRLHALSLANGQEMLGGPVIISATVKGNGAGSNGKGSLSFDPSVHLQRPGLALVNGLVYLAFGSRGDLDDWHGWLMSYNASTLQQVAVTCLSPNGYGASIWGSGRAPAFDSAGNIYVSTGNGSYDGTVNFGESILKLSGKDLTLLDWYTPNTYEELTDTDSDLGSSGIILIPGSNQLVTAGKSGDLFVVERDSMGHLGPKNTSTVQNVQANKLGTWNTALWTGSSGPIVYVQELLTELKAFQITNGHINTAAVSQASPENRTLFAGIAISGDASNPNQAIVWWTTGNLNASQLPGTLHALNAANLSNELWNSDMVATDAMGRYAKFVPPTVANGRVYVPTFSHELSIYGLLSGAMPGGSSKPQVTGITNAASFAEGAIAPGELVAIFGADLGPAVAAGPQVGSNGHLSTVLSHTKVYFGGVSAPLLYASANQVGAVVPFGISGSNVLVQVQNGGSFSKSVSVPVAAAAPAVYSKDGSGGELGALINQDGNPNSFNDPAPRGSVITMWATGIGQLNPAAQDGQIVNTVPYPSAQLPVTVTVDNQPAQVLYAGAAPGMVAGLVQINVRIPEKASTGQVNIQVMAGTFASPNTVTVVVK